MQTALDDGVLEGRDTPCRSIDVRIPYTIRLPVNGGLSSGGLAPTATLL
jgi:hypothetical protein